MKPTIAQMNTWFTEFNGLVFESRLPKVPITFNNTRRQLGQFYYKKGGMIKGIKISLFYDRTETQYRNTLLHEMCHLYCFVQGWYGEKHGYRWQAIAEKAYRITGLYIQRCEHDDLVVADHNKAKMEAVLAKKNAPAILIDLDYGTYHFIVKTTKKVVWENSDGNAIKGMYGHRVKGVYISDNPRVVGWQNSRSLHRGYKFPNDRYNAEIKPILDKAIVVEDFRKTFFWGEYDYLGIR